MVNSLPHPQGFQSNLWLMVEDVEPQQESEEILGVAKY